MFDPAAAPAGMSDGGAEAGRSPVLLAEPAATGRAREKPTTTRAELENALRGGGSGGGGGGRGGFKDIPGTSAVSPGSSKECVPPESGSPSGAGEADYCRRILVRGSCHRQPIFPTPNPSRPSSGENEQSLVAGPGVSPVPRWSPRPSRWGQARVRPLLHPGLSSTGAASAGPGLGTGRGSAPDPGGRVPTSAGPGDPGPEPPASPSCCSQQARTKWWRGENTANNRDWSPKPVGRDTAGRAGLGGHRPDCSQPCPGRGSRSRGRGRCQAPAGTRGTPPG
ncbi:ventral anterior homeobox 2 isoform X5 [Heliangelus exortis]|uniref:ventral anterior homeobox 2 isoform X5 n=1 Tax=Heliangelus exortis TaxID=472823 RepID=UPI003A9167D0